MTGKPKPKSPDAHQRALAHWARIFAETDDPATQREAARRTLEEAADALFRAYPSNVLCGAPARVDLSVISALIEALRRVDQGESPSLFMKPKRSGAPLKDREATYWFANASAAVTALMTRFDKSETAAATAVVAVLRQRKLPVPGDARSDASAATALQSYRDQLMRGARGGLALAWYDDALLFSAFPPSEAALLDTLLDPSRTPSDPLGFDPQKKLT